MALLGAIGFVISAALITGVLTILFSTGYWPWKKKRR